jgi:cytochrome c-type biogenesis protein CcmH/NrfF
MNSEFFTLVLWLLSVALVISTFWAIRHTLRRTERKLGLRIREKNLKATLR